MDYHFLGLISRRWKVNKDYLSYDAIRNAISAKAEYTEELHKFENKFQELKNSFDKFEDAFDDFIEENEKDLLREKNDRASTLYNYSALTVEVTLWTGYGWDDSWDYYRATVPFDKIPYVVENGIKSLKEFSDDGYKDYFENLDK